MSKHNSPRQHRNRGGSAILVAKRPFLLALALAVSIVLLAFPLTAVADKYWVGSSDTVDKTATLTAWAGQQVTIDATVGVSWNGNSHLTPGSTVTFSVDPAKTTLPSGYAVSQVTLTIPGTWVDGSSVSGLSVVTFKAPAAAGNTSYTVKWQTSSDPTGGPALTINLTSKLDSTPPTITATRSPLPNANGWNSDVVTVNFTCTDDDAGIQSCTERTTVTAEGSDQYVTGTAVNNAGLSTSVTVGPINVDKTPPVLVGSPTTTNLGNNGWYTGDVTVYWTCTDNLTDVSAYCPGSTTVTGEGAGLSASASVSDLAGNSTDTTVGGIKIDRHAPSTSANAPTDWTNTTVPVTLSAYDVLSGLAATYYSVDGGGQQLGTVVLLGEGIHELQFWSIDDAGNVEPPRLAQVKIDRTAPTIDHLLDPTPINGWNNSSAGVVVTFVCSDPSPGSGIVPSGVASCGPNTTITSQGQGQSITGTATDNAGNSSSDQATVSLDWTAPTIEAMPDRSANGNGWYRADVVVSFSCADALSGIAVCPGSRTLGEGAGQLVSGTAIDAAGNSKDVTLSGIDIDQTGPSLSGGALTQPDNYGWYKGDVTVRWTCSDALSGLGGSCQDTPIMGEGDNLFANASVSDLAGNTTALAVGPFKIDRTAPSTSVLVPTVLSSGWYTGDVQVELKATDGLSGVDATFYSVDGGSAQTYTGPFLVGQEGNHAISFWSTDKAGNAELPKSFQFEIDKTRPTVAIQISLAAGPGGNYGTNAIVTLTPADSGGSGLASTEYSLDGRPWTTYDAPFAVSLLESTTITLRISDNAGNQENKFQPVDHIENFPLLASVASGQTGSTSVLGVLQGIPATTYAVGIFAGDLSLGTINVSTDSKGTGTIFGTYNTPVNELTWVRATTVDLDPSHASGVFSVSRRATTTNLAWSNATPLATAGASQHIVNVFQEGWYKISGQAGAKFHFNFTGPLGSAFSVHYDPLPFFNEQLDPTSSLASSANALSSGMLSSGMLSSGMLSSGMLSSGMLSSGMLSSGMLSSGMLSSGMLSSGMLSSGMLDLGVLSSGMLSSGMLSSGMLSSGMLSSGMLSSGMLSSGMLSSGMLSSGMLSSGMLSSGMLSSGMLDTSQTLNAYSWATLLSVMGYSVDPAASTQTLDLYTYDYAGDIYIRVVGPPNTSTGYTIGASVASADCGILATLSGGPVVGGAPTALPDGRPARTIILTDRGRLKAIAAGEIDTAWSKLNTLALRPEVAGYVIDLSQGVKYPRVAAANSQADGKPVCTAAKNVVANEIKAVIDAYRAANPGLKYIVLAGGAEVIPYYQSPDRSGPLAPEKDYIPPVLAGSPSEAGLKKNLVQGQDFYGSKDSIWLGENRYYYMPDLAVGRLVDLAADITKAVDTYLNTGGVIAPTSSLVTGYDFVADAAQAINDDLRLGLNATSCSPCARQDTLIEAVGLPPSDPTAWHADSLRAALLNNRHDIIALAGHFSAGGLLAADYGTTMNASELSSLSIDVSNTFIMTLGCHPGYTLPLADEWTGVSPDPDWAKAFLRGGAAGFVGATGYAYGDSDLIMYGERFFVELTRQLRTGSGDVSLGQAVVRAKQAYLGSIPVPEGLDEKTLVEMSLYGLPMMKIRMPGQRYNASDPSIVASTAAETSGPGSSLGLSVGQANPSSEITSLEDNRTIGVGLSLTPKDVALNDANGNTITARYLVGKDGATATAYEPLLPLALYNISPAASSDPSGSVLRGVALRGGTYVDTQDVIPLTSVPATELSSAHPAFNSSYFYPSVILQPNFYDALSSADGVTRLALTPAQFRSTSPISRDGTLREFNDAQFRLYYLPNNWPSAGGPAMKAAATAPAPTVLSAMAVVDTDGQLKFSVRVASDTAAGLQAVWILYTSTSGNWHGTWRPLDLTPSPSGDPTLFEEKLPLGSGVSPADVRFMVQAVNGAGLTTLETNGGVYFGVTDPLAAQSEQTNLTVSSLANGTYRGTSTFSARLFSQGVPLANQAIMFTLGGQGRGAITDAEGYATVDMWLAAAPGNYAAAAYFSGTPVGAVPAYKASSASSSFAVTKAVSAISVGSTGTPQYSDPVWATLRDGAGNAIVGRPVKFTFGAAGSFTRWASTNFEGVALLGNLPVPAGTYQIAVSFDGDDYYTSSQNSVLITVSREVASVTLGDIAPILQGAPLQLSADVAQAVDGNLGDLRLAQVRYRVTSGASTIFDGLALMGPDGLWSATTAPIIDAVAYSITAQIVGDYFSSPAASASVVVSNAPPIAAAPADQTTGEGATTNFQLGSFSDPGSNDSPWRIDVDWGDGSSKTFTASARGSISQTHTYSDGPNTYTTTVRVTDKNGGFDSTTFKVNVQNVAPTVIAAPAQTADEGAATPINIGSFSDPGTDDLWMVDVDWGDSSPHTLASSVAGELGLLTHTYVDGRTLPYAVRVTVTDNDGSSDSKSFYVTVKNAPPVVSLGVPIDPIRLSTSFNVTATFTDSAGVADNPYSAVFNWDDGKTTSVSSIAYNSTNGTANGSHSYTVSGLYNVSVTVTDKDGGTGSSSAWVVVYDPNGSYVTGNGTFNSPAGAYYPDPSKAGVANFGFVSKYLKGATVPTGETEFQFKTGDVNFHSTDYKWLVISGPQAQYKGTGTINGQLTQYGKLYGFLLTVIDGQVNGGGGTDKFRIKIWVDNPDGSQTIVYDNGRGAADSSTPPSALTSGSIIVKAR